MTPPLPPRGSGEGLVGSAPQRQGAGGGDLGSRAPSRVPRESEGQGPGRAWRAVARGDPFVGGGVSEGWPRPRNEPRGPDREGLPGGPAPPSSRPPSRASWRLRVRGLFVLRRWGPGRPHHPTPGSRERPGESPRPRRAPEPAAPSPQRPLQALCPRPTAPPWGWLGSLARAPRGASPSPLPGHGPSGLDASSSAAAARSKPGAGWTGPGGPVSTGRGGRRAPSRSAGQSGAAIARRLSRASPRAPWPRGLRASSTVPQAAPPSYLGPPTVISDFDNAILPPVLLWAPPKFPNLLCYPGLLSLLCWVFLLLISSVTLEPALGPLLSAANPLLSLRTSSLLSPQDDCPLSRPLLSWCSLAVSLPSLESYGYSGLGPEVPHAPPSVVPTFLGRTPYFPPGTPWYSLSLRRLGQAAGRELCQVPRLPCQKEALDPFPTVSSPLGALPSLELLAGGSPIGQMQS